MKKSLKDIVVAFMQNTNDMNRNVYAESAQCDYVRSTGGGGENLKLLRGFPTTCNICKNCYNSDMKYHIKKTPFSLAEGATHVALLDNYRKNAFTLAEVLITLGIIGIVAALVIPGMIVDYRKKATAMALKKSYAELNLALTRAQADYGSPRNWDYNTAGEVNLWAEKYIAPYVNKLSSKDCKNNKSTFCLGVPNVSALGYPTTYNHHMVAPYLIVKNGGVARAWAFYRYGAYDEVRVRVYLNVPQGRQPVLGKEVFTFVMFPAKDTAFKPFGLDGTIPFSSGHITRDTLLKGPIRTGGCFKESGGPDYYGPGDSCGAVIMLDDWKIKDDYPWN